MIIENLSINLVKTKVETLVKNLSANEPLPSRHVLPRKRNLWHNHQGERDRPLVYIKTSFKSVGTSKTNFVDGSLQLNPIAAWGPCKICCLLTVDGWSGKFSWLSWIFKVRSCVKDGYLSLSDHHGFIKEVEIERQWPFENGGWGGCRQPTWSRRYPKPVVSIKHERIWPFWVGFPKSLHHDLDFRLSQINLEEWS